MALTKTLYPDNEKLLLGTDSDLEIFSNNSTSIIDSTNQNLDLQSSGVINIKPGDASGIIAWNGAQVELYHNANKRLNTTANGVMLRGGSTKEHWCEGHLFPWTNGTYDIGGTAASDSSVYYWRDGLFSRNLILRGDSGEFRVEAANGVDALTVDSDNGNTYIGGNVGIGVSPSKKLHVKGTDVALRLESTEATGRIGMEFYDTSAQKGFFGYPSSGNDHMAIQQNEAADFYLYVNGADRLHIASNGYVGIGTASPLYDLHVSGSNTTSAIAGTGWAQLYLIGGGSQNYITSDDALHFHVNNADRVIFQTDGDVKIPDGDLIIGTAGHGISFDPHDAVVSSPGSDSNLLDDYEEGTFSPTLRGYSGSSWSEVTFDSVTRYGWYTKIGNVCRIWMRFYNFHIDSGFDGDLAAVGGLPFLSSNTPYKENILSISNANAFVESGVYNIALDYNTNSGITRLYSGTGSGYATWSGSTGRYLTISGSYSVG